MNTNPLSCCVRKSVIAILLVAAGTISSCTTVRLVSDYDEPTDKALSVLQKSSDEFIAKLMAAAPSEANAFDKHKAFYDDADRQLRQLEFRVTAIPGNSRTVSLVGDVRRSLLGDGKCSVEGLSLRDLHCIASNTSKGPSRTSLQISQRNVNQTIGAALALELAKKQGLEQNN